MINSLNQRISVEWAARRVVLLDSEERFEDSFAITQEFCEWTTCLNTYPEGIKASTMMVPNFQRKKFNYFH